MKKGHKTEKVNSAIKKALSEIFIYDIPLEDNLLTIVRVDTSPDLTKADIYITALKDVEELSKQLNRKKGYIGHLLGQRIKIRRIPDLRFIPLPQTTI